GEAAQENGRYNLHVPSSRSTWHRKTRAASKRTSKATNGNVMAVESIVLGRVDGREIRRFHLIGANGMNADVMNYGATLTALRTPDRDGRCENVVLGFDALAPYLAGTPYFGATVGRYANRIACARFTLDGVEHELAANEGHN